jgi:D-3-phosphoglycerate dehydrogenase
MFHIVVSDPLAEEGLAVLRADDVRLTAPGKMDRETVLETIGDADALIVRSGTQADREVIERGEALKIIGRAGVGVDNIDLEAATEHGIIVMNAPSANTNATAEHALALMLALARHVPQGHASLAAGEWARKRYKGFELRGKTLGLIGAGRIGREVGVRALAFGMRVVSFDPYVPAETVRELGFEPVEKLDDLLAEADIVTLHALVTPETTGMINAEAIAKMKDGARLVNVARGALVDEAALAAALDEGKLAGAALDVYAQEPPQDNPLVGHPKVVHTPHLAASTAEAQSLVSTLIAEQVLNALRGDQPRDVVNPEVLQE